MSNYILTDAWKHSRSTGPALLVLISLADQASDEGFCYPSVARIAERCRISKRSVHRHLDTLEDMGEITRQERHGYSSAYLVHPPTGPAAAGGADPDPSGDKPGPDGDKPTPTPANLADPTAANLADPPDTDGRPGSAKSDTPPDTGGRGGLPLLADRTITEPSLEPSVESSASRKRGCRLPDGWMPDPETIDKMRADCPGVDLRREHERFTDYWHSVAGAKATKRDWDGTWRNWIRKAHDDLPRQRVRSGDIDWDAAHKRARERDQQAGRDVWEGGIAS